MNKYRIVFHSKKVFAGTPKEIVRQMRDDSFMDSEKPLLLYMLGTSRRHKIAFGKPLNCASCSAYVNSLANSEIVKEFTLLDN